MRKLLPVVHGTRRRRRGRGRRRTWSGNWQNGCLASSIYLYTRAKLALILSRHAVSAEHAEYTGEDVVMEIRYSAHVWVSL